MLNLEHQNKQFIFHIDGNDQGTSRLAAWLPLVAVVASFLLHVYVLEPRFPDKVLILLSAEVIVNIVLIGGLLRWLSSGKQSRYSVSIDPETKSISARDKKNNVDLWEADYEAENLYLSEIKVFIGQEIYAYPALVYGEDKKSVVEAVVPYPELSVLAFGEKEALTEILGQLS